MEEEEDAAAAAAAAAAVQQRHRSDHDPSLKQESNPSSQPPPALLGRPHHSFWNTQPVQQLCQLAPSPMAADGPIQPPHDIALIRPHPFSLPPHYEWCTCDVTCDTTLGEIHALLKLNYVEDVESMFRFDYSKEFLQWALCPPNYHPFWHVGVRVEATQRLVAFITGIPARVRIRDTTMPMAEINFLCIHKKLRSKRLAPLLIRELTRRVHLMDMWQAIYTAGIVLPTPVATCQYWHRSLNPEKLIDIGFSTLDRHSTLSQIIDLYRLPDRPMTPGFRMMEKSDVPAVCCLLQNYLARFAVAPLFSEHDVDHWFLPAQGLVYSFVVADPATHCITDFCSFYVLHSTVLGSHDHRALKAAYSFYNANTKHSLSQLIHDALIVAKQENMDVFNALDIMQNEEFFEELKFRSGDGSLHYYLYNYYLSSPLAPQELGLLLL